MTPMSNRSGSSRAEVEGSTARLHNEPLSANPYLATKCPGHMRHWYTMRGVVGAHQLTCWRCGTEQPPPEFKRLARHWRDGWYGRDRLLSRGPKGYLMVQQSAERDRETSFRSNKTATGWQDRFNTVREDGVR